MRLSLRFQHLVTFTLAALAGLAVRHFSVSSLDGLPQAKERIPSSPAGAIDEALKELNPIVRNQKLRLLTAELSGRQIHAALTRLAAQKGDFLLHTIELELLSQWTAIDPRSALAWVDQLKDHQRPEAALVVMSKWLEIDEPRALAWVENHQRDRSATIARSAMLRALAIRDPKKAVALLQSRPKLGDPVSWSIVFSTITSESSETAFSEAELLPEGRARNDAIQAIAFSLSASDPVAAEAWIKTLPPGSSRRNAMNSLSYTLTFKNPKEAIRLIMSEASAGYEKGQRVQLAVHFWATDDPMAVRDWLRQLPDDDLRKKATSTLMTHWAEKDPEAAVNYALATSDSSNRIEIVASALHAWVYNDQEGGLAWIGTHSEELSPALLLRAAEEVGWSAPSAAVKILEGLPDGDKRNEIYLNLATAWTQEDPVSAVAWLDQMPEGPARDGFMKGYLRSVADADISRAMGQFETLPEGAMKDSAAADIALAWGKTDPRAALDWVIKTASIQSQERAAGEILNQWAQADDQSTAGWLETIPQGPFKDTAVQQYSIITSEHDPAKAASWAMKIVDSQKRRYALRRVIHRWFDDDPTSTQRWIQSSDIPEDWKKSLLKQ
jgi:hypothetical protein